MRFTVEFDELDYCTFDGCRWPAMADSELDCVDTDEDGDLLVFVERVCLVHGWRLIVGRAVARIRGRLCRLTGR